jgi:predicted  nucleic acid-binding Zn-ribbon protein
MTKKQKIANLEKHIEELQDEVKNVKEYISEMKKEI